MKRFVTGPRALLGVLAATLLLAGGTTAVVLRLSGHEQEGKFALLGERLGMEGKDQPMPSQGGDNPGGEAFEALTAQQQFAEARTAPSGIVDPGAYSAAVGSYTSLPSAGGAWSNITRRKYDADSPAYRDFYSNSGGGSGLVSGRITGLAADAAGNIYAAAADGGVWRRLATGGGWTPISDALPSLSSGYLAVGPDGALWYATGEANTGGTSYVGSGVYRLANPTTGTFGVGNRVGGDELESTTIGKVRFSADGKTAWAATLRGVWSMPLSKGAPAAAHWTLAFAPNPQYLPSSLAQYVAPGSQLAGATFGSNTSSLTNVPYKNIANDVAVDPTNAQHVIAAIGWRSGDSYNGFYESKDAGKSWAKVNPTGAIPADDIGYVTFAYAADGSKLYAINQAPSLLQKATGTVNSYLDGIYVSNSGSPAGPWSKVAEQTKLANSGSALKQSIGGKGYGPGIQSWYNQFLAVDPTDPNHVYAGLEEVYETTNAGASWNTVGPYWNFYFSCWAPDAVYNSDTGAGNRCPLTTHPDQHSVAIGGTGANAFVVVGNDGGVYTRPLHGSVDGNGNATDWRSLNDGTIDALQYYAVGVGFVNPARHTVTSTGSDNGAVVDETTLSEVGATSGVLVSGGLQDNGGSLLNPAGGNMVSNFGGDGGDVLVDPNDGCNIVQEYVYLSMTLTQTCGHPTSVDRDRSNAFLDVSQSTEVKIDPNDVNARFIAPFVANKTKPAEWLAGGNSLWLNTKGWAIRSGSEWAKTYTLPTVGKVFTALAMTGDTAAGAWCGPCNNSGFARGVVIGHRADTGWQFAPVSTTGLPRRFVGGVAVASDGTVYAAINGFSRRFTEGEGAGIGHVYRYDPASSSWSMLDGTTFPDVPANSIQVLNDGSLVVGTDIGVLYEKAGTTDSWKRLGTGLPLTVAMDVEQGPDGKIYAATHGRGIWSVDTP